MGYIIKYIDKTAGTAEDFPALYSGDLKNGDRVVFVFRDEGYKKYFDKKARVFAPSDISRCPCNPMYMYTSKDAGVTAVELARRMWVGKCVVYTRYRGVFTSDPDTTSYGHLIDRLDYDEALEMRASGYRFAPTEMVEKSKKYGIALDLSNFAGDRLTVIKEAMDVSGRMIKGVIKDPNVCIISLTDIPDIPGISYRIFEAISEADIVVDIISLPASGSGKQDISFTVRREDKKKAERVLRRRQSDLGFSDVVVNDSVAKVSAVGAALRSGRGVAAAVFKVLYENNISLRLINTSEIKISVIIDRADADLAVRKIHENFIDIK